MTYIPKSVKISDGTETAAVDANNNLDVSLRDGTNVADIDSDGNQSVSIREGTDEAAVQESTYADVKKGLVVIPRIGGSLTYETLSDDLDTGDDAIVEGADLGDAITGYIERVIISANKACKFAIGRDDDGVDLIFATVWIAGNEVVELNPVGAWRVYCGGVGKWHVHAYNTSGEDGLTYSVTFIFALR